MQKYNKVSHSPAIRSLGAALLQWRAWPLPVRSVLLVVVMIMAALGQTATEMDSPEINRIASKLKCSCGCNQSMACVMPPGCPICKMNKARMVNMKKSGMSDQQILAQYVTESGQDILIVPPGIGGVVGPYVALGLGLILVLWTIRRYLRPRAVTATAGGPEIDPATLAQIEKDTADLD
jgi:cytochrome c-type biogenesis protein CcmH/NrfF